MSLFKLIDYYIERAFGMRITTITSPIGSFTQNRAYLAQVVAM